MTCGFAGAQSGGPEEGWGRAVKTSGRHDRECRVHLGPRTTTADGLQRATAQLSCTYHRRDAWKETRRRRLTASLYFSESLYTLHPPPLSRSNTPLI